MTDDDRGNAISVLVVDDHPVVRAGIAEMLDRQPDITVVGQAIDGTEAVQLTTETTPDVVLMDLRMPGVDGVTATQLILAGRRRPRILVLTTYDTDGDILRAIEAGASGYLLKDAPVEDLLEAVRATARGETVMAPTIAARLDTQMSAPRNRLTGREVEVLRGVARGLSNAEIGAELFITEATVKTHLIKAFAKLGVDDRTRAVTVAMTRGFL